VSEEKLIVGDGSESDDVIKSNQADLVNNSAAEEIYQDTNVLKWIL
jgi:hypothetical protein